MNDKMPGISITKSIVIASILVALVVVLGWQLTTNKTPLESILIQIVQLVLTLVATVLPTRALSQRQERAINENRARMAIRRAATLYKQMNQVAEHIEKQRAFIVQEAVEADSIKLSLVQNSLDSISDIHKTQYGVMQDIENDWRDVLPAKAILEEVRKESDDDTRN